MIAFDHSRRTRIVFWILLALAALATAGLVMLLPHAGSERRWTIHWLPGAGPMEIGLGETGLYAALVTAGACLVALTGARAESSPATGALALLALLGGAVAFLTEHFLLRYAALEIVALSVALAPLAKRMEVSEEVERGRWARLVYLVLRIGDAGLMVGVLALWSATGTLEISPALEAGVALRTKTLAWVVGGLLLAVWVKLGGWPMHVWQQAGGLLSLFSRTWLYRILMPNLGLYLLYRITPLIGATPRIQTVALWAGALGAAWAAVLALVSWLPGRESALSGRLEATMVFLGAVQGGLALVLAALGLKTTVWLALLALTPLRLMLSLAGDVSYHAVLFRGRWGASAVYGLGGAALIAFDALILWWVRQAGVPLVPRLLVEVAVGFAATRVMVATAALWRGTGAERAQGRPSSLRGTMLFLLAYGLVAAIAWREPLLDRLAQVSHGPAFVLPDAAATVRLLATSPAGWAALVLGFWVQFLARRGAPFLVWARSERELDAARAFEQGIGQGAGLLRAVVEAGALSGALAWIARGVVAVSRFAHRWIEGKVLEGATRQIAQTATESGRLAYRWIEGAALEGTARQIARTATDGGRLAQRVMEQGGLEGLLRRIVRAVMAGSRWLQRRHTGRLRRNLIWVAASLALALVALILFAW